MVTQHIFHCFCVGVLRRSDSQSSGTGLARSYGKRGSSSTLYSGKFSILRRG